MFFFPPSYLKRQLPRIIHGFVVHGDKNVSNHHWQKKKSVRIYSIHLKKED